MICASRPSRSFNACCRRTVPCGAICSGKRGNSLSTPDSRALFSFEHRGAGLAEAMAPTRSRHEGPRDRTRPLETPRQPVRHEVVTHVSGTFCYLCGLDMTWLVPQEGFEPPTPSLRMTCSTN